MEGKTRLLTPERSDGGQEEQPGEGFPISLTSNGQEETSAIAAVSSLSFFGKRNQGKHFKGKK